MRVSGTLTRAELASAEPALAEFSKKVREKAKELVDSSPEDLHQLYSPTAWEVQGRGGTYKVHWTPGGFITCTCPYGMNNAQARCYHAAAVLELMTRISREARMSFHKSLGIAEKEAGSDLD